VLRERLASRVEHTPGAQLCADLLTKPVVTTTNWDAFRVAVGLVTEGTKGEIKKVAAGSCDDCRFGQCNGSAKGQLMLRMASAVGTASAVGVAALTALLACSEGIGNLVKGKMNLTKGEEDPTRASGTSPLGQPRWIHRQGHPKEWTIEKRKGQREDEPWPRTGVRDPLRNPG